MKRITVIVCALIFAVFLSVPLTASADISQEISKVIAAGPAQHLKLGGHGFSATKIDQELKKVYEGQQFQPFWTTGSGPSDRADILLSFIESASEEGLSPENYRLSKIQGHWNAKGSTELAQLDILLTLGLASYIADISEGHLNPKSVDPKLFAGARNVEVDIVKEVREALATNDLRSYLKNVSPTHRYYNNLRNALKTYRELEREGGWEAIPDGETLKVGMSDPRVPSVRKRLSITRDYQGSDLTSPVYDEELSQAIKGFQFRHQLEEDGKLGKGTLAELNVPAKDRVRQIVVNMERWRWTDRNLDSRQVFVNIAGYKVAGVKESEIEFLSPVIVGRTYTKTPVFSDTIEYVEVNPYWNVPSSIARNEYLPKLQKDPGALDAPNIKIFRGWDENAQPINPRSIDWSGVSKSEMNQYRLRQEPGKKNALGRVKIMFPNQYNVYLHDTPNHALFSRTERTFSHGCIRVHKPLELASYVLGGASKGWSVDKLNEIVASGERKVIKLDQQVPVHILYRTVSAMDDGLVRFQPDIYKRDALLKRALFDGFSIG